MSRHELKQEFSVVEQENALPAPLSQLLAESRAREMFLRDVLIQTRDTLQFENESPNGVISDTIWLLHGQGETLFDYLDGAIVRTCPDAQRTGNAAAPDPAQETLALHQSREQLRAGQPSLFLFEIRKA